MEGYYGYHSRGGADGQPPSVTSPAVDDFDPLSTPMPSRSSQPWPADRSSTSHLSDTTSTRSSLTLHTAASSQTLSQSTADLSSSPDEAPSTPPPPPRTGGIVEPPLSASGGRARFGSFEAGRDNVARHGGRRDSFRNPNDPVRAAVSSEPIRRRDSSGSWTDASPNAKNPLLPRYSSLMQGRGNGGHSRVQSVDSNDGFGRTPRDSLLSSTTAAGGYTDDDATLGPSPRKITRPDSTGQGSFVSFGSGSGSGSGSSGSVTALVGGGRQKRQPPKMDARLRMESAGAQTLVGSVNDVEIDEAEAVKSRSFLWSPTKSMGSFMHAGPPKLASSGRPRLATGGSDDLEATAAVEHPIGLDSDSEADEGPGPLARRLDGLTAGLRRRKAIAKIERWIDGPVPPRRLKIVPFFPRLERFFSRLFGPVAYDRHPLLTVAFLIGWLLGMIFLVRSSWYLSSTAFGAPRVLGCTDTFWARNDGCGVNGTYCAPFDDNWFPFRCPAQCASVQLLNTRTIGDVGVDYRPLVVGGAQDPTNGTYRGDSFICQAALHAGLFGDSRGGCGVVSQIGAWTGYPTDDRNGIVGTPFPGQFPSAFRFWPETLVHPSSCKDLRNEILGFNVGMTFLFSFVLRPDPLVFFWVLACVGFWVAGLATDPAAEPPVTSTLFATFLPFLFVCYALWRSAWRFVLPTFGRKAVIERTVLYLGPWWVGVLLNLTLEKLPVQRLTAADISKQPGGLATVIVVAVIVGLLALQQIWFIRRAGLLVRYLRWYVCGVVAVCLLLAIPGFEFRLHHYFIGIILTPGTAILTRPSAVFQGFLLGMLQDGVARWGFESILQTPSELIGDAATGSALPGFLTNSTNFARTAAVSGTIQFVPIPANMTAAHEYDGFALLVDDVERYQGPDTNYSYSQTGLDPTVPHFFRLAYSKEGVAGDFTKAAVMYLNNMTWYDPELGPS